ncbi:MAG: polymerase subunit gamma and tau [Arthrobacter sp.]|nr:polymerase subunit gamma and tau [Arthrobacter sp.]
MTALRKNRVNHAYLFSGPRGCGKTTSARILARCLNCAEGPTDTPCGSCPSCIELARGGSGSLDVIEIDAASHGGVDDARDLRERATYAPVRDRYKIFIIDEAHMVTSAGFNALLKIVEEPPEHIKFIFATTEPDKVIGTIRSRTHHYPFRLVPPEPLMAYLELLCKQEDVPVAPGVLSLVIRAGGGSVRDSLSVLDQLMAGAGPAGLDYELAVALLGYTHASLLDDVVEAVAASDSATVFRAVDRVIQTGHDPRRFVEDLLERFRDLIIVQAMPESAQSILRGMPADQIARMQNQAHNLGAAELSRAADVANTALTEMTGATSPRLHLELLCARILLPSSEQTERGIAARIDRVERRLNYAGNDVGASTAIAAPAAAVSSLPASPATSASAVPVATMTSPAPARTDAPAPAASAPGRSPSSDQRGGEPAREPLTAPRVSTGDWPVEERAAAKRGPAGQAPSVQAAPPSQAASSGASSPVRPEPVHPNPAQSRPVPAASVPPAAPASGSKGDVEVLRRAWPEILQTLTKIKRSTWALVEPNAQVGHFEDQVLTLAFTTSGLAGAFGRADHAENLRQAIHKTIGIDCQIQAVAGGTNSAASSEPNPKAPASRDIPATSIDADWGLAPDAQQPAPRTDGPAASVPAVAAGAIQAPVSEPVQGAQRATAAGPPAPTEPRVSAPAFPSAEEPAPPAKPVDLPDSYAYPDDDWGPPRDEDAPPLDEEPPMDWDPSAPAPSRALPAAAAKPAPKKTAVPAGAGAAPSSKVAAALQSPDASDDPWGRAVEQTAGIWTVGAESNVGPYVPTAAETAVQAPAVESEPSHYEPAAAQVPPQMEGTATRAAPQPAVTEPAVAEPAVVEPAVPVPAVAHSNGRTPSVPAAPPAPDTRGRQSLYQRLSNSPEAEAGRAKAPARAASTTAHLPDIPSADDETIEESGVFGRAAVERILGGKLVEERSLDGSPLPPRF